MGVSPARQLESGHFAQMAFGHQDIIFSKRRQDFGGSREANGRMTGRPQIRGKRVGQSGLIVQNQNPHGKIRGGIIRECGRG